MALGLMSAPLNALLEQTLSDFYDAVEDGGGTMLLTASVFTSECLVSGKSRSGISATASSAFVITNSLCGVISVLLIEA